ncbi:DUF4174 domain-containing protein [Maribacter aurantiacus]|uniref:DUF4174 domain-containing protein n=1 Tax=Maribacter aurantiacus TaxID=1882343 RepID=A0A5R8LWB8_9FLAO|nr:DUF4174 domain-containing protein [Maribacter aurantiacus]TLF41560.1 DUF4174 domain-containing protein [Maribacter aurantiacus]
MKILAAIITLLMSINTGYTQNLSDYQWNNRVLILSDATEEETQSNNAFKQVTTQMEACDERDMIVLFLRNNELTTPDGQKMSYKISLPTEFNGYLLIGKDGGIKMKGDYPLDLEKVFDRIDGMPMRRAEMRNND